MGLKFISIRIFSFVLAPVLVALFAPVSLWASTESVNLAVTQVESPVGSQVASSGQISHSTWFGHNLSQTSYIPKKKTASVGTQVAGVSMTDSVFIGTSPWLYISYNMHNIFLKGTTDFLRQKGMSFTVGYFKTAEFYPHTYDMEAYSLWGVKTIFISEVWRSHINLNYMLFEDETIPFSLRREPFNDEPYQFSLTSLNELLISKAVSFGAEIGVLGLNYTYPHIHVGVSVQYKGQNWLAQLGVSGSSQMRMIGQPYTQNQASTVGRPNTDERLDSTTHPEVQIQYYF